jgi:DNA-directed RNA polymerase subunit RPC12/RpoP
MDDYQVRRALGAAIAPFFRKFYLCFIGIMTTVLGWAMSWGSYRLYTQSHESYVVPMIFFGFFLPFICVGGEIWIVKRGRQKIRSVYCHKCGNEFSIETLFETHRCPKCRSRRLEAYT